MKKTLVSIFSVVLVIVMFVGSILPANALSVGDEGYIVNTGSETYTGYDYSYSAGGGTGGGEFLHMTLRDDGNTPVYCVEPNAPFTETYYRINTTASDSYWKSLSKSQQEGIALALIFGYPTQNAKALGVTSADDAYSATQAVVWEYAAGVRKSPSEFDTSKPEYDAWYKAIKGSPAETAYKSLRTQMKKYMESYGYNRDTLIANTKILMLGSGTGNPEQAMIYYTGKTPEQFGAIEVYKKDENGNGLAGARFEAKNNQTGEIYDIGPTDSKGYAITKGGKKDPILPYGTYTVTETVFPVGYQSSGTSTWTITVDDDHLVNGIATLEALNTPIVITLKLKKKVASGYDATGLSIAGAEYILFKDIDNNDDYNDGDLLIDTLVIDEEGNGTSVTLPKGTNRSVSFPVGTGYKLKETKAPAGFLLDQNVYNLDYITAPELAPGLKDSDGDDIFEVKKTVNEYPIGVQVRIRKRMENPYSLSAKDIIAEDGAEFQLYNSSKFSSYEDAQKNGTIKDWDYCVTNEKGLGVWINGEETSRALNTGTYTVHQTKVGKNGLTMSPDKEFAITESMVNGANPLYTVTFRNDWKRFPVEIYKVDQATGKIITVDEAVFTILDAETGEPVILYDKEQNPYSLEKFSTVNGKFSFGAEGDDCTIGLPYGKYELVEIAAPDNYILSDTHIPFEINEENEGIIKVFAENELFKGTITVNKFGDRLVNVTTSDTEFGKMYTPVYEESALEGVVFNVTAAENILGGDNSVVYQKGELVDTLTTGKNGTDTTKELPIGKYIVTETKTLAGYGIDKKSQEVEIKYDKQSVSADFEIKFTNDRADAKIDAVKKAVVWKTSENNGTVISELVTVAGVGFTFGLYADETFTASNGATIEKDSLVAIAVSDKDGNVVFSGSLPFGKYYVKELAAPEEHYVIPDTKYPVTIDTQETTGETIVVKFSESEILNDFIVEEAEVIKIDAETGKPMKGVKIEVKDTNGKVWYCGYTDTNGKLNVILEPGSYTAQEIETLDGYLLNSELYAFNVVKGQKEPSKVEIKNSPLKGTITIDKKGPQFVGIDTKTQNISSSISTPTENVNVVTYFDTVVIPVFEDRYLANVKFNIVADEDICSPDGQIQHKKGDVVETLTTSLNGPVTSKELWPGKYLVIETETNAGYQLDTTPKSVEVTNDGNERVSSITSEFYNNRAPYEVNVVKEMVKWETITDGDTVTKDTVVVPGANFVFGLFASEDIALYDGSEGIKADSMVALGLTDEEGNLKFNGSLPFGNYYVKELAVPKYELSKDGKAIELSMYKMSDTKYPVTLSTQETTGTTIVANASDKAILNDFDRFPVVITKTDLVTSEPVPGAKVTIYNSDGEIEYTQWTSENGTLPDIILEPGTYTFEEIVAPEGYICNTTVFEFTINTDGTVDGKVDFTNTPTKVTITKTDAVNGKPVAGAEITIYEASPDEANATGLGDEVYKALTDANGQISVSYLKVGKWYIYKETKAANGFAVNKNTFAFMINEDGTITGDTTLVDDYTRFKIYKVNEKDKPMKGVVFTMYDEQGNPVATATTDEAGVAEFVGFLEGKYTIKETKTWDKYDLAPDSIKIVNDGNWDNEAETSSTTVKNYPTVIPPKTGDNSNFYRWIGIGGASLAVIALVLLILKKKKSK